MLSIPEARALLGYPEMADREVEVIRDACYTLAELAIDAARSVNQAVRQTSLDSSICDKLDTQ